MKFSVSQRLSLGVGFIIAFNLVVLSINVWVNQKVATEMEVQEQLQLEKALFAQLSSKIDSVTLGYMDAIVDKDSMQVDQDIVGAHEDLFAWTKKHKDSFFEHADTPERKQSIVELYKNLARFERGGNSLFEEVKTHATGDFARFDDVLDGTRDKMLNLTAEQMAIADSEVKKSKESLFEANELSNIIQKSAIPISLFSGIIILLVLSRKIKSTLDPLSERLTSGADTINVTSQRLSESSSTLSDSVQEQASALQETASSVEEITSTIHRNAETADRTIEVSERSAKSIERGKRVVTDVLQAVDEIGASNDEMAAEVKRGNQEIGKIVDLISEIEQKTRVINDIVFQTKLLSFNASVEAARAGEHGKGFAVVAEEVGKLAQMSGSAAEEIEGMLEESSQQVRVIVHEVTKNVDNLVERVKTKINYGTETVSKCEVVFSEIYEDAQAVAQMLSDIASATREQSTGIEEVNRAIQQLNDVTQKNTVISDGSASMAEEMQNQGEQLTSIINDLREFVYGPHAVANAKAPVQEVAGRKSLKLKNAA